MPVETIRYLLDCDIPLHFIRGNGDREVFASMRGAETSSLPQQAREAIQWVAQQLSRENRELIASWPKSIRMRIGGWGEVLFCHATPRNDTEMFTRLTPEEWLLPVFNGLDVDGVVCGHTHMQFDRKIGGIRVVNAGSVGMPFGEPGAYWLLLKPEVELRRTQYDFAKAAERIRRTNYPQAEEFAARNILRPPSQREMLEAFSRVELN